MGDNGGNVVDLAGEFRGFVHSGGKTEFRSIFLHQLHGGTHVGIRAFIDGDTGFVCPALFLHVLSEIAHERSPELVILRGSGCCFDGGIFTCSLIKESDAEMPRNHGIATDLLANTDFIVHEMNPRIQCGVIVAHLPILAAHPAHHGGEPIVRLRVPRLIQQRAGDAFLPGFGKPLHDWFQQRKVLRRPRLDIMPASNRLRVLPEVKVNSPVFGLRQMGGLYLQLDFLLHSFTTFGADCDKSLVKPGLGGLRNIYLQPDAANHSIGVVAGGVSRNDVGGCFPMRFGIEEQGGGGRDAAATVAQRATGNSELIGLPIGADSQLGRAALTSPCTHPKRGGCGRSIERIAARGRDSLIRCVGYLQK